jgi:ribosomal protein S27E
MKIVLIHDKFRKRKGGIARLLRISCAGCGAYVLTYQKDGIGRLLRLYFDRILEAAAQLQGGSLVCPACGKTLGLPGLHHSGRMAYRLVPGSFLRKRAQGGG